MIREHSRGYKVADEISEVLGDHRYQQTYYPPGLKELTVGPHSLDLVSVSRFYFLRKPPVIVDFEPSPLVGKMWLDEKRKWCWDEGVAYLPILLGERVSKEQFAQRLTEELEYLKTGVRQRQEDKGLAQTTIEDVLKQLPPDRNVNQLVKHPAVIKWIDAETLKRFDALYGAKKLYGVARQSGVAKMKAEVILELRERIKYGRVGHLLGRQ